MKKLLALAVCAAFFVGIVGCDDAKKTTPSTDTKGAGAQPSGEMPKPPPLPPPPK